MPRLSPPHVFKIAVGFLLLSVLSVVALTRSSPASSAPNILFHTTLDNAASITSPTLGLGGTSTLTDTDFVTDQGHLGAWFQRQGTDCSPGDTTYQVVSFPVISDTVQNIHYDQGEIEFWYRPDYSADNPVDPHALIAVYNPGNSPLINLTLNSEIMWGINDVNGTWQVVYGGYLEKLWEAGEWVHLRAIWDKAQPTDSLQVYVNAVRVDRGGARGGWALFPPVPAHRLLVGAWDLCGNYTASGIIDDLIVRDAPEFPAVLVSAPHFLEGNAGGTNVSFTGTLSAASAQTITLSYLITDTNDWDSARPLIDYMPVSGTLTFSPGITTLTFSTLVTGNTNIESNKRFYAQLSNPDQVLIGNRGAQAWATIINDDGPTLWVSDASVIEGDTGTTGAVVSVTLSVTSTGEINVNYETAEDEAQAASDYLAVSGWLTFAPGVALQTFTVPITGDALVESDEALFVYIGGLGTSGATIADGDGRITIRNDDAAPTFSVSDASTYEGNTGTANLLFRVTLSQPLTQTAQVDYATSDGTATSLDYTPLSGTLTFLPGVMTRTVTITVNSDTQNEPDEMLLVNLNNAVGALIGDGQGRGQIVNDDFVSVFINNATVTETTPGAVFTLTLSLPSAQPITVTCVTTDNTALAGNDYVTVSRTVSFPAGVLTQTLTISLTDDALDEGNENFFVKLSSPLNAVIGDDQGVGIIVDDDPPPSLSINEAVADEGASLVFTLTLSTASGQPLSVDYTTANLSATANSDYAPMSGTINFLPGMTTRTITVTSQEDALDESVENFLVNVSNPINVVIGDDQGVGRIIDNDPPPTLFISDASVTEGQASIAVFTITLATVSGQSVSVNYLSANGTAIGGSDYMPISGTLVFPAGMITQTLLVMVTDDLFNEETETFTLTLQSPLNAVLGDGEGVSTIVDNDVRYLIHLPLVLRDLGAATADRKLPVHWR